VPVQRRSPGIRIVADVHERASGIPDYLEAMGVAVELAALPAGDYAVGADTLVERKAVSDLHSAILKGRLWPQLNKLRAASAFPYLLVEGGDLDRGPLHPNSVRGACLAAIEKGIALLRSSDRTDSARWLHRLALRCQEYERAPDRLPPGGRSLPKLSVGPETAEALLAAIPGISSSSAQRLLLRFGSVAGVASAEIDELLEIPGIGPERARLVVEALRYRVPV
jgi:Fanconi anemia group M protein